ncbi:putative DNA polymerase [Ralstonia phage DU_RP_II]|nr:putative DNA polymerase [Ralstonia phage DU_RP_II]
MTILHIDLETCSACELRDRGLHNYAADPTTDVHCAAYAFDDEPVEIWLPGQPCPPRVSAHIKSSGRVIAHNFFFEIELTNNVLARKHGWPKLSIEQGACTMAAAYAMGLPGALENAAPALGLAQRKDAAGKRVMLQLAKPRAEGGFWAPETAPEKFEQLYAYCKQDVEVERALHHRLMELSDDEQRIWQLDYRINQRGIRVDLESIDKAIALVEQEKRRLDEEMLRVTGGVVGKCTEVQVLVKWIRTQGVEMNGLAKADVLDALAGDLPPAVEAALRLRKEAAKSSTAKLVAMKERASADGRVRGCFQYHGAATGRWAHRGIQPGNMPRPRPGMGEDEINDVIANLHRHAYIDMMYGPTMDAIADSLRGMIVAEPGNDLAAVDFSAIEARVLAWLAGQESVLDIFRTHGKIYEHAAASIYHVPMERVTKGQRQIGKVSVLALGFGGGVGAFQSMARVYGVKVPDAEADEIKSAWRAVHPAIVSYWYDLERAAIRALTDGGVQAVGPRGREVKFRKAGSFLWLQLPSKRVLCYPYPELRIVDTPWGEQKEALTYMTELDSTTRKKLGNKVLPDPNANGNWCRISTYGGSLAENVTQAVAADLLRYSMETLESAGYPITLTVHDEAVVEIASSCDDRTLERIEELMAQTPAWAAGLPVSAEGWRGPRYRK